MRKAINDWWLLHDARWWLCPSRACAWAVAVWLLVFGLLNRALGGNWPPLVAAVLAVVVIPLLLMHTVMVTITLAAGESFDALLRGTPLPPPAPDVGPDAAA